ncbi:Stk1 family PASTA domain-containing Ser/Thr kinase [Demequina sediminicola]|uniref:Stk1 family PASTA domain-containing Ser/Thr kinase n=1 Tax=Demequina sediminicola TaxID=1095026 RepID=UPI0007835AD5|nr:Stk1 family PASTA domain-containing Ser/Thr kinase [Demequina sediminicola]
MSETLTDPLLGRLIDGRYEVRERIAAGGMATVYVAFDNNLEREIALKVMHPHLAADATGADFVARFQREAKAAARLTHSGMVRVYDQGVDGNISYLTMEYVRGENLRQLLNREGTLSVGDALDITDKVLAALSVAHAQGLVHRDLKPENVLIDSEGEPKLTDFGLARAVTEVTSTTTGTLLGTVAYLAPELVTHGTADTRTDVYAAGILLYELLTGTQPFSADTALALASRNVHEDVPPPSSQVAWLPVEIDEAVATLTSRAADARPQDARAALALVRDLHGSLDDPTLARRATPPSGAVATTSSDAAATAVLHEPPSGSTVALPIGLEGSDAVLVTYDTQLTDDDPEAIEPEQQRHRAGWWIGAIAAALLVMGALGIWWYQAVGPGAYTTVPDVTAQTAEEATRVLTDLGFDVTTEETHDDAIAAGNVVNTDPAAQQRALNGAEVTIFVSLGKLQLTVPDVTGMTSAEAEETLTDVGFTVADPVLEHSDTVEADLVIAVSPEADQSVDHDTPVELTVSEGPEPIETPDLVGMTEADALALLQTFGIDAEVNYGRTESVATGEVYAQTPEAGTAGTRTQAMTITVSEGLPLVTIQDVRGMKYADAKAALEADGLTVTGDDNPWNFSTVVFNIEPAAGTDVEQGSGVYLEY